MGFWNVEKKRETRHALREQHNGFLGMLRIVDDVARGVHTVAKASQALQSLAHDKPVKPPFVHRVDRWGSVPFGHYGCTLGFDRRHDSFADKLAKRFSSFARKHDRHPAPHAGRGGR